MAGGRAAGRAAEGIIAKAVKDLFRVVAKDAGRDTARDAARDVARDVSRDVARDAGRDAGRDSARDTARSFERRTTRGDPVDVATGEVVLRQVDVELPGLLPLLLHRTHLSSYRDGRWFGPSWTSTLDQRVEVDAAGVRYYADDGARLFYPRTAAGLAELPVEGSRLPLAATGGRYTVTDPAAGRTLHFAPVGGGRHAAVLPLVAVTDRNGHRIDLDHDADGTLVQVRHSGGYRIGVRTAGGVVTALGLAGAGEGGAGVLLVRFGYDADRRLVEVVDSSGQPLRFGYDADGRLTSWQDRAGTSYRYRYDDAGRCVATSGTDGRLDAGFDYRDRVTGVTDSLGRTSEYHLNGLGQVVAEVDPLGQVTRSERDRYDRLLARTDPLGRTTRYEYDPAGNLVVVSRPDGHRTTAAYNDLRLPVTITDPDGAVWRREYDGRGNLLAVTDPTGTVTRYAYADKGLLQAVTDGLGHTTLVGCDPAGLPVRVTDPYGAVTGYARDGFGRVTAVSDPLGNVTRYGWTVQGRLAWRTLPDGATDRWSHDAEGNQTGHTDPLGQVTVTEVGPFDLPVARTTPDGARLEFTHDTELRLVAVTNPQGLVWRYEYDAAGNLVRETDFDGRMLGYRYDAARQLIAWTNGAGETVELVRDAAGNVVEQRAAGAVTSFGYDPAGRVIRASSVDAEVLVERDVLGRVVAETCNGRTVDSGYDRLGRRVFRRTPSGVDSRWAYDAVGRPVLLETAGHALRFGYDAAGREVARRLGAALLVQDWDGNGQLRSQTVTPVASAQRLQHRTYTYRADGYLSGSTDAIGGPRDYQLDPVGQVTAVGGAQWTERYGYDLAGNVVAAQWPATDPAGQGGREYAGTVLRRAGGTECEHDAQGRLIRRRSRTPSGRTQTWTYEWDATDRLIAVTTPDHDRWRYAYDPFGRRIAKHHAAPDGTPLDRTDFTWDGVLLAEQADTAGRTTTWDWQPGTFRPLSQHSQDRIDQQFHAIVADLVGTPTDLVTPAGDLAWHHDATLWGTPRAPTAPSPCPLRFPGQYHDPETGLHYNYARYYDPTTARYQSPDPVGLDGGPHPHSYVPNPTGWIDFLGLSGCPQDVFVRRGTSYESAGRLGRMAEEAEATGRFPHGVSVTSPESNVRLSRDPADVSTATREQLEGAGFPLVHTPTARDPDHHTLVLPSPVTSDVARRFNQVFGRSRR